ncbi:MAG: ABC transporter permease [Chloroflexi bacterium]|nr:ABC transporter permease [Chloroflexota bacterium]
MKIVFIVWLKEMLDTLRDRRTLWAMVLGPVLIMPLFIILPQKLMTDQFKKQESAVITVAVSGGEHAPGLMAFLRSGPTIEVIESDALESLLRDEKALVGLRIPENFEADLAQEKQSGQIVVLSDQSKMTAGVHTARALKFTPLTAWILPKCLVRLWASIMERSVVTSAASASAASRQSAGAWQSA